MSDKNKYAGQIEAAKTCLNESLEAFNARDLVAYERTFNFPSIRLASNTLAIVKMGSHQPGMYNRSELNEWDHSGWDRLKVIHAGEHKVHFEMRLTHFRKDGSVLTGFDAIYIVTNENGHWGIKVISSYAA